MVWKQIILALPLLVTLATTTTQLSTAELITPATNFTDYIKIVEDLSTIAGKLRVLKAVWAEIRTDYYNELDLVESLHKTLHEVQSKNTVDIPVAQANELKQLQEEVEEVLVTKNGQFLAPVLNDTVKPLKNDAKVLLEKIFHSFNYDTRVSKKIFEYAIDKILDSNNITQLAAQLNLIHANEVKCTEIVYHAQLYLYGRALARNEASDEYLLHIAYYLQQPEFKQFIDSKGHNFIKSLPTSVQSLFFSSKICILNVKTREYLYEYTGEPIDSKRQRLHTWRVRNFVPDQYCAFNVDSLIAANGTINAYIRNTYFKNYIYRDEKDNNKILSWLPTEQIPPNGNWTLGLNDNKIRFFQNDLYLCSAEEQDSERLNLRGIKQKGTKNVNQECEWIINNCPTE